MRTGLPGTAPEEIGTLSAGWEGLSEADRKILALSLETGANAEAM